MPRYREYAPETWAKIKEMWKTGKFATIVDLHKAAHDSFMDVPCVKSIKDRVAKEGDWEKSYVAEKIEKEMVERAVERFAARGLTHERIVDKVIDGIEDIRAEVEVLKDMARTCHVAAEKAAIMDKIRQVRKDALAWIQEYKAFTGSSAPLKKVIEIDMEARWRVAQEDAANKAYKARLERIKAEKEKDCQAKSGEKRPK
jgi:hypothetical protein